MRILLLALNCLLVATPMCDAAILERDFLTPGDGLLTYDDVNEREWLDLPYSLTSLSEIQSEIVPGGLLAEFRFASIADVYALRDSVEVTNCDAPNFSSLVDHLGFIVRATGSIFGTTQFTLGQVAAQSDGGRLTFDDTNVVAWSIGGGDVAPGAPCRPAHAQPNAGVGLANATDYVPGTFDPIDAWVKPLLAKDDNGPFWLYREAIPEPTSLALVCIAVTFYSITTSRRRCFEQSVFSQRLRERCLFVD